jgi:hypothetical protein
MVHDLVNGIEGVFFVDDGVEQDTKGPDILFFTAIGFSPKNFGGGVV